MNGNKGWRQGFVEGYGIYNNQQPTGFAGGGEVDKYMKELQARRAAMPSPAPLQAYIDSLNARRVPNFQNIAARGRTNPDGTTKPWAKAKDFPYTGAGVGGGGGGGGAGLLGTLGGIGMLIAKNPALAKMALEKLGIVKPAGAFAVVPDTVEETFKPEPRDSSIPEEWDPVAGEWKPTVGPDVNTTSPGLFITPGEMFPDTKNTTIVPQEWDPVAGTWSDFTPTPLTYSDVTKNTDISAEEDPTLNQPTQSTPTTPAASSAIPGLPADIAAQIMGDTGPSASVTTDTENVRQPDEQPQQTQPTSTSAPTSALPAAVSAGLPALASTIGSTAARTGTVAALPLASAAGSAAGSALGSGAANFIGSPSPAMLGAANQAAGASANALGISNDLFGNTGGFNVTTAGTGGAESAAGSATTEGFFSPSNLTDIGLNVGASLLGNKMWGQGNETRTFQNFAGTLGGIVGGPLGNLAGNFLGSLLDEGSNPDPLVNPLTGQMVEWNDPEWEAVKEYHQRNYNTPEYLTSYNYSNEDQARLESLYDMAASNPSSFDPNAVSGVTTAATGVTYTPMSYEELAQRLGYKDPIDQMVASANKVITDRAMQQQGLTAQQPTTTAPAPAPAPAPAAAQPQTTEQYYGQYYDPNDPYNFYDPYQFNMAEGGEVPSAGESDLGPHEYSAGGKFLRGDGDGMSDDIVANIDGTQEARLADGEFVVPADVVSHLGNGSSEAGSRVLYAMMDRVRKARTGTTKQGKQIDPDDFVPA